MIVLKNRQIPQKSWSISSCAPPTIRYLKVVCEKSCFQLEMSKLQETEGFKSEWKLMHLVWIEKIWDGSFRRFANGYMYIMITLGKNFLALHLRTLLRTFISEHPFETDNPLKLNPFVQKWKHSHVRLSSKQGRRTLTVQQQQSATLFTNCTNCCSKIERPAQIEDFLVCFFFLFWM